MNGLQIANAGLWGALICLYCVGVVVGARQGSPQVAGLNALGAIVALLLFSEEINYQT